MHLWLVAFVNICINDSLVVIKSKYKRNELEGSFIISRYIFLSIMILYGMNI